LLHLTGEVKLGKATPLIFAGTDLTHTLSLKIADLGLCGGARSKARHTIAGSRSFMAPEMIKRNGYNQKVSIFQASFVPLD